MLTTSWAWLLGVMVAVVFLFVALFRLSSTIVPDEHKGEGEKWWGGGE